MDTVKFLVAALALGANAPQSSTSPHIGRTYNELKQLLNKQRGPGAAYLIGWFEEDPNSKDRRIRMEELFAEKIVTDEAIKLATRLVSLVRQDDPHIAEIAQINLNELPNGDDTFDVPESGGMSITGSGNIVVGNVKAGVEPVDPWPVAGIPRK